MPPKRKMSRTPEAPPPVVVAVEEPQQQAEPEEVKEDNTVPLDLEDMAFTGDLGTLEALVAQEDAPFVRDSEGNSLLHFTALFDHRSLTDELLHKRANINAQDLMGQTPLWWCIEHNKLDEAAYLVTKGAQIGTINKFGVPLLHSAIIAASRETVAKCLDLGADPMQRDAEGHTALHWACSASDRVMLSTLMESKHEFTPVDINTTNQRGRAPLHSAARFGRTEMISALLLKDADPNLGDALGRTALHYTAERGFAEAASALLTFNPQAHKPVDTKKKPPPKKKKDEAADVDHSVKPIAVDAEDKAGCTALQLAMDRGHTHMVALFVQHNANVQRPSAQYGTLLHQAVRAANVDLALALLGGGGIQIEAHDQDGLPALHRAVDSGGVPMVKLLVEHGADKDAQAATSGKTALHVACASRNELVVEFLLGQGAAPDIRDARAWTPLHVVGEYGAESIAGRLVDALNDPEDTNAVDLNGRTPLHIAAQFRQHEVARLLLARGARTDLRDSKGWGPLHVAVDSGCARCALQFLECGNDANEVDLQGDTPMVLAARAGRIDCARLLVQFTIGAQRTVVDEQNEAQKADETEN